MFWLLIIHWKDWCWSWSSNTLVTWWKESTHWKRPWCWERLRVRGEGGGRGWDGGWHHWLNGQEFEQTLGNSDRQGSDRQTSVLSEWGCKGSDPVSEWTTARSFNQKLAIIIRYWATAIKLQSKWKINFLTVFNLRLVFQIAIPSTTTITND